MASDARTILTAVRTTLRNADGTGQYNFDLSATDPDQVSLGGGGIVVPPRAALAHVQVFADAVRSGDTSGERGPIPMGYIERRMDIGMIGWAPVTDFVPGTAMLAALDLLQDIQLAIEATRVGTGGRLGITGGTSNNPWIRDMLLTGMGVAGTALDETWTDWGIVDASLTVWWTRQKGGQS